MTDSAYFRGAVGASAPLSAFQILDGEDGAQQMSSAPNRDGDGRDVDGGGPPGEFREDRGESRPQLLTQTATRLPDGRVLKSEIPGVSDAAWTEFAIAMKVASPGTVSASNDLGMFGMKVRRLADLGLVKNITNARSPTGRMVWVGEWVAPMSQKVFLESPAIQYRALVNSMKRYVEGLRSGTIARPDGGMPKGTSLSGVLAILHRCGPGGLQKWTGTDEKFPETIALFERGNGIF